MFNLTHKSVSIVNLKLNKAHIAVSFIRLLVRTVIEPVTRGF